MSRILGIDHGSTRIGLAISDELQLVASPLRTLDAADAPEEKIATLIRERHISSIVIGYPLHMNGQKGEATQRSEHFAEKLDITLHRQIPIHLVDERLSSREAEASLTRSGVTDPHARRQLVDQLAATIILQDFLNSQRGPEGFLLPDENPEIPWLSDPSTTANKRKNHRR